MLVTSIDELCVVLFSMQLEKRHNPIEKRNINLPSLFLIFPPTSDCLNTYQTKYSIMKSDCQQNIPFVIHKSTYPFRNNYKIAL